MFRYLASLFCKTATAFNPFIYFFMSKGFRQDFIVVMHRLGHKSFFFCLHHLNSERKMNSIGLPFQRSRSNVSFAKANKREYESDYTLSCPGCALGMRTCPFSSRLPRGTLRLPLAPAGLEVTAGHGQKGGGTL